MTTARDGWEHPAAPGGRLFPVEELAAIPEGALLGPDLGAALVAVGRDAHDYAPERPPLVLIHGVAGHPANLQAVARRLAGGRYQIHVLCYADLRRGPSRSGDDLARALGGLPVREAVLVGHSLGGIVGRWALNRLRADRDDRRDAAAGSEGGPRWRRLQLVALDCPFQGFGSDEPLFGARVAPLARAVLPPGMRELHVTSPLFVGAPGSDDPVARAGLFGAAPGSAAAAGAEVVLDVAFCAGFSPAWRPLGRGAAALPERLRALVVEGAAIAGDGHLVNFWRGIADSRQGRALLEELRAEGPRLDLARIRAALERHFPRWPGDHNGFLREQPPGVRSLLDHLEELLPGPLPG